MTDPVSPRRISIAAEYGLQNVDSLAVACREAEVPFAVACALVEKESMGRNVYGHDAGGALSGFPLPVTRDNFRVFAWMVQNGHTSNGVGPCQITYPAYFTQMDGLGLRPWVPEENMVFGLRLLRGNYDRLGSWERAGAVYNGGPHPDASALAYGKDLAAKIAAWRRRFH